MTSRIPGFYRLGPHQRVDELLSRGLISEAVAIALKAPTLSTKAADSMTENVVSTYGLPNSVAVNFLINGRDRLVPMVVEEPSVVAAASNMARIARLAGGFTADSDPSIMIAQLQLTGYRDFEECADAIAANRSEIMGLARALQPRLVARGGGLRDLRVRKVVFDGPGHPREESLVLHLHLDCVDAMGANMINTLAEALAPHLERITGATARLRILSNLADERLARATVSIPVRLLGPDVVSGRRAAARIAAAWRFAWADPYRAATHNKGVMNGVDAVVIATGNDWRAVEAGAHAFAARDGQYRPLTTWRVVDDHLVGDVELPLQVGVVGGCIRVHPTAQANLGLLDVSGARELAGIIAAVGLAQNLGALRALSTEGIQRGHMRLQARNVAVLAGALGDEVARVSASLVQRQDFSLEAAHQALELHRRGGDHE